MSNLSSFDRDHVLTAMETWDAAGGANYMLVRGGVSTHVLMHHGREYDAAAIAGIAHGRTASYLDIAKLLNNPKSVRAVGAANGQNPLAIVWPCHRVVGADGSLTGYAGGLVRKQWLLAFEQPARQGSLF